MKKSPQMGGLRRHLKKTCVMAVLSVQPAMTQMVKRSLVLQLPELPLVSFWMRAKTELLSAVVPMVSSLKR
jgi:hypothetical protein